MLKALGVPVRQEGAKVSLTGGAQIPGFEFTIPGDISSAAFFLVAAAIVPQAQIEFSEVSVNPTRSGIFDVLKQCGVKVTEGNRREQLGEPSADMFLSQPEFLQPFTISGALVPRLIDEIPVLSVLATQCDGVTRIRDAGELRVKESDRIELIAANLRAMGAKVETAEDGLTIEGPTTLKGAKIETAGDHRIAMAFAIAGLIADGETMITNAESIKTSYPNFESDLWSLAVV
jgi:3-phosphoshikimate 1-carboxyvinyltransferase